MARADEQPTGVTDDVALPTSEWIPLSDGVQLSARVWLPAAVKSGESAPVPAILEYVPYRKDDGTAREDAVRHPYFAAHGYAAVRVDLRGSGDSDGILLDEYLPQEQQDALEAIRWIAAQDWCSGDVGMIGYSWGGFNGLQVAALAPPELKAVVTICSTDDRYADDCHYKGGVLLGSDMLKWASWMLAFGARPPDPLVVGSRWREMWDERLHRSPAFVEAWVGHQTRDDYWKQGSVAEDMGAIRCPVYAVGGWADPYRNAIPRLLEGLDVPVKGLIGPWSHMFPHEGVPGPAIDFLAEAVRWFDAWMKGADDGIRAEPALRVWLQDPAPPRTFYEERQGRWLAEEGWPPPDVEARDWVLTSDGGLVPVDGPAAEASQGAGGGEGPGPAEGASGGERADATVAPPLTVTTDEACGLDAGVWCPNGLPLELPDDQRADDELSLCFDSEPFEQPLVLLGRPRVRLELAADRPRALVAVRLCDVAPDGSSYLLSWGMLDLTHRDGHEHPLPVEPGSRFTVDVDLDLLGQLVPPGHRLRVAVSPGYWPHAWPSPEPVTLSVFAEGEAALSLPVRRPPPGGDPSLPPFAPPGDHRAAAAAVPASSGRTRVIRRDTDLGTIEIEDQEEYAALIVATSTRYSTSSIDTWNITRGDPLSANVRCERIVSLDRKGWHITVRSVSEMSADAGAYHLLNRIEASEGSDVVHSRQWESLVPRI